MHHRKPSAPVVYVSARHSDVHGHAGRLQDRAAARFGPHRVVGSAASTLPGADIGQTVAAVVGRAAVMVAVIGPRWEGGAGEHGGAIDHEWDPVRLELGAALAGGVPVLPVLVNRQNLPPIERLPAALRPITDFTPLHIDEADWDDGCRRVLDAVAAHLDDGIPPLPARRRVAIAALALVAGVTLSALAFIALRPPPDPLAQVAWLLAELADSWTVDHDEWLVPTDAFDVDGGPAPGVRATFESPGGAYPDVRAASWLAVSVSTAAAERLPPEGRVSLSSIVFEQLSRIERDLFEAGCAGWSQAPLVLSPLSDTELSGFVYLTSACADPGVEATFAFGLVGEAKAVFVVEAMAGGADAVRKIDRLMRSIDITPAAVDG